jgi:hypothetical protein
MQCSCLACLIRSAAGVAGERAVVHRAINAPPPNSLSCQKGAVVKYATCDPPPPSAPAELPESVQLFNATSRTTTSEGSRIASYCAVVQRAKYAPPP